jgi:hypothetical protein
MIGAQYSSSSNYLSARFGGPSLKSNLGHYFVQYCMQQQQCKKGKMFSTQNTHLVELRRNLVS